MRQMIEDKIENVEDKMADQVDQIHAGLRNVLDEDKEKLKEQLPGN